MRCATCGHDCRPGAKFCEECGARLPIVCNGCGGELSPAAKFCSACGRPVAGSASPSVLEARDLNSPDAYTPKYLAEKILTSKAALEGERKLVTVLFADLKSSMELFADRDPEEARRILDPVIEYMMEAVHRFEGTVNHVLGDGIVALFGAPIAHEDHAVRACFAALRMQESVQRYADGVRRSDGIPVQIRVGLNSGDVVVRSIGSDLRMDYTVVGQTTNVAARMEQMAVPGSILLSAETMRLADDYVEAKPLGAVPVKGLEVPLESYELIRARKIRSRFQAAAARGLTRLVGRDAELNQLSDALQRTEGGHGQVVAVVGEAGVGKSRLFWEFSHTQRPSGWRILESSSVSYGKATNYLPLIELLRSYFSIESTNGPAMIRASVGEALRSLDRELEPWITPILWLLDVPVEDIEWQRVEPAQRRQRILDGIRRLLLRESQMQPLMVLCEDLHWLDDATQVLLDSLVESLAAARILLLVNYRPEYRHDWGSKTFYRQIQIEPLRSDSAEGFLDALLGSDATLGPLKRQVIERTEGNPFFMEETVRALVETGVLAGQPGARRLIGQVERLQVPATAHAIIAARIDRLEPDDKRLLQTAAVIGFEVPFDLLKAVSDEPEERLRHGLSRLQATEFLYEKRLFPTLDYTFRHALTHEVTYGSLLAERRRAIHARIVAAMEQLYGDRLTEHVEALAHHAVRGELRNEAAHYLGQAGAKAAARSALQDARTWLEQALAIIDALPEGETALEQAFEVRLELRTVLTQLGELAQARERLLEADAVAVRLRDDHRLGRVSVALMTIHSLIGDLDDAIVTGTRALEIARRLGDLSLHIPTTSYLEQAHYYRGEYEKVVELATDALAALPPDWVDERFGMIAPASVYARSWLVMSLSELGRFSEALDRGHEAIRLAEATGHAYTIGLAHRSAGTLHLIKGEWAKARLLLDHGITVLSAANVALSFAPTLASSAWALAQLGMTVEAAARLREGEQAAERLAAKGRVQLRGWDYHALGRASFLLGRHDEAERLGHRAAGFRLSQPGAAAYALHLLGDLARRSDGFDAKASEAHYLAALALAQPRNMRPLIAQCHFGLGKVFRQTGKRQLAGDHHDMATDMAGEMGITFWAHPDVKAVGEAQ